MRFVHLLMVGAEVVLERGGECGEVERGEAVGGVVALHKVLQVSESLQCCRSAGMGEGGGRLVDVRVYVVSAVDVVGYKGGNRVECGSGRYRERGLLERMRDDCYNRYVVKSESP